SAENQTPSLEKPFASVVANPPWYVPAGIARREILPKGPGYLAANDMYVANGTVIQRAGPKSALGYVKFELRDSYAIFLHDTPSKAAFNLSMRQRSHGCVRVQNAVEFARLLLSPDPAKLAEFDTAQQTRETTRVTTGARNHGAAAVLDRLRGRSGAGRLPRGRLWPRRQAGPGAGDRRQPASTDRRR
ncbi:Putative peptidoglycan binding domain protein, partial [Streptomyces coelicoflavus ZG0656]